MYVELLDGRFAGHTRDIEASAALGLIKVGRAKRAFADPAPEAPLVLAADVEPVVELKPKKRK